MEEHWKPVEEDSRYEISNLGRIRSKYRILSCRADRRGGYIVYRAKVRGIYGKKKEYKIHRLVAKAFIPNNDPLKIQVNHIDGNKQNNHATNLEWVTNRENTVHGYKIGLFKNCTVLNEDHVKIIRALYACEVPLHTIVEALGYNTTTVRDVVTGRYWNEGYACES